jgi:hypothetical protein
MLLPAIRKHHTMKMPVCIGRDEEETARFIQNLPMKKSISPMGNEFFNIFLLDGG